MIFFDLYLNVDTVDLDPTLLSKLTGVINRFKNVKRESLGIRVIPIQTPPSTLRRPRDPGMMMQNHLRIYTDNDIQAKLVYEALQEAKFGIHVCVVPLSYAGYREDMGYQPGEPGEIAG